MSFQENHNANEHIKIRSNFLRGTLTQSLADELTGSLAPDDHQICKFHGFYEQDDRDQRQERQQRLAEPHYEFMLRARVPGGVCTPGQWLAIDRIGRELGNGTVRLTTRQTFQYHGIAKRDLKPLIQGINEALIDSIGGCGDINRNILCNPTPNLSALHAEVYEWSKKVSEHLLPKTRAYHEIWLDGEKVAGGDVEPIYGETYLPRKFKTAFAVPPQNDVDIYTNDLGFIAIVDDSGKLTGFNVTAGGGMGTTHGDKTTFPRLADTLGFITPDQTLAAAEAVVTTQRDFGNRVSRRHARLKYTVETMGSEAFKAEVEKRAGFTFGPAQEVIFRGQGDRIGWTEGADSRHNLTVYIENGRVADTAEATLMTGLREIANVHQGDFRITANQNLVIAGVPADQRDTIESLARQHGLIRPSISETRLKSIACVSLPTCPQAMAESERYFPEFMTKVEAVGAKHNVDGITIRMTGCPNGCARPFAAEIGFVGKAPGRYNVMLGGDGNGLRLNKLYRENLNEAQILDELDGLFGRYAAERNTDETFGNFVVRASIIKPVFDSARDFHD